MTFTAQLRIFKPSRRELHNTVVYEHTFDKDDKVGIAILQGKDFLVNYGSDLFNSLLATVYLTPRDYDIVVRTTARRVVVDAEEADWTYLPYHVSASQAGFFFEAR